MRRRRRSPGSLRGLRESPGERRRVPDGDGRATGGPDPLGRVRQAAALLVAEGAAAVVVDCETSFVRLGLAEQLAGHLGAPAVRLAQLRADTLTDVVRTAA